MSTNEISDYAFGGPTLPLFVASYNDICYNSNKLGILKSENGYMINKGDSDYQFYCSKLGDYRLQKGIYFQGCRGNPCESYWVASPGAYGSKALPLAYFERKYRIWRLLGKQISASCTALNQ